MCTTPAGPALLNDPSPDSSILLGLPQINTQPFTFQGVTVAIGQVITQRIIAGIVGKTYVLTFTATLSTAEIFVEQVKQTVTAYVPPEL